MTNLKNQRRLASRILKVGLKKVNLNQESLTEIKEAITKFDIRGLINQKVITVKKTKGQSKVRARKLKVQKRKGRRQGKGSRKGKKTARSPRKKAWMAKVRTQRRFIQELRKTNKIEQKDFKEIYKIIGTNFFRNRRHIKIYMQDHNMFKKNETKKKK